jgi:hypothetical protein
MWQSCYEPFLVIRDLGRLVRPADKALDLYRRWFYYTLSRLEPELAVAEIAKLRAGVR